MHTPTTIQSGLERPYHKYTIEGNSSSSNINNKLFRRSQHRPRLSDRIESPCSTVSQSFSSDISDLPDAMDRSTSIDSDACWNPNLSPSTTTTTLTLGTGGGDSEFRIPPFPLEAFSHDQGSFDSRDLEESFVPSSIQISCDESPRQGYHRRSVAACPPSPHEPTRHKKRRQHVRNTFILDGSQQDLLVSLAMSSPNPRHSDRRRSKNRAFSSSQFDELLSDVSSTSISSCSAKSLQHQ